MSFRKNALNYFVWIIFMMCNLAMFSFLSMLCAKAVGGPLPITAIGMVAAFFGVLFLIYFITGFISKKVAASRNNPVQEKSIRTRLIMEGLLAVCILAAGVGLRIYLLPTAGESAAYYEVAKVTQGQKDLIVPVQNSIYYYLCLLRGMFLLLGNHWVAGIWLQIGLQIAATVVLYFVIRKMTNVTAAMITLIFLMFAPSSVKISLMYAPDMLYFLFWSLGIFFVMLYLNASSKDAEKESVGYSVAMWLSAIPIGCLVGFLTYVDVAGAVLLLPVLLIPAIIRTNKKRLIWVGRMLLAVLASLGGFVGAVYVDSLLSHTEFVRILSAWVNTFAPEVPDVLRLMQSSSIEVMILLVLMSFNVFSFFRRKQSDIITVWMLMTFAFAACYVFGITTANMNGRILLLILMCVVAAVGIRELFRVEAPKKETVSVGMDTVSESQKDAQERYAEGIQIPGLEQNPLPKFLDNPLPLPKKHVKKSMDYAFVPETARMKYDVEISETDDFDV